MKACFAMHRDSIKTEKDLFIYLGSRSLKKLVKLQLTSTLTTKMSDTTENTHFKTGSKRHKANYDNTSTTKSSTTWRQENVMVKVATS